jgi:hypothetical protein
MRAFLGAVAAPDLARDYPGPKGLFGTVMGRIQARAVEKSEDSFPFAQ